MFIDALSIIIWMKNELTIVDCMIAYQNLVLLVQVRATATSARAGAVSSRVFGSFAFFRTFLVCHK
jgi:hypothetical protein